MESNSVRERLRLAREEGVPWKRWGPYLSERQWGTVREDYSDNGDAWSYFPHDHARSRAYRWGEDGLVGISDDKQRLCFALALWNEADPILKERLFGVTGPEGNHGEDVKEYYYYLDSTPTHDYMRALYKYPQAEYPYLDLLETNRRRTRDEMEYELIDTGIFNESRYFDIEIEYAKASPEDIAIRITAHNRGPDAAPLHLLPTLWFRNTWSWGDDTSRPEMREISATGELRTIATRHPELGDRWLYCAGAPELLFTENESNAERLWGAPNRTPYVKDGINNAVIHGQMEAVNPEHRGTKVAAHYKVVVPGGEHAIVYLRLSDRGPDVDGAPFDNIDTLFARQLAEADAFYTSLTPAGTSADEAQVMRQALAGMLWTKQYYGFNLATWLDEHDASPLSPAPRQIRNHEWFHMLNDDIISMPDKWEYPWYAAWDLAFHTVPLVMVDPDFGKGQLDLLLRDLYLHPNGQVPAYEWNFSDVNPPVHAWATMFIYMMEQRSRGQGDLEFLRSSFHKLLMNFTWWVNRKDPAGRNVFEGGFLGLDNIGVFDRSAPLPTGGHLEQADGTAWMAFYCQCMLDIALELATYDSLYEDYALKFIEHFFWIAGAMDRLGDQHDEMWDEEDGFFYDVLRLPDGRATRIRVRSMVGLLPFCAATLLTSDTLSRFPSLTQRVIAFLDRNPELRELVPAPLRPGPDGRRIITMLDEGKLRRVLMRMLDEEEFFSPYGIRAISRYHRDHPFIANVHGQEYRVDYWPAESHNAMFGGNSNWRGPIWFPVNALIFRALLQYYGYYGDDFRIECPTGSGNQMTLFEVANELARRLSAIFLRDAEGRRPVFGGAELFQNDPNWRDHLLFYEYFHGDNGAGLGASHQTGWTGLVAPMMLISHVAQPEDVSATGRLIRARRRASAGVSPAERTQAIP